MKSLVSAVIALILVNAGIAPAQTPSGSSPDSGYQGSGARRGFIIGFGVGPGYTSLSQTLDLGFAEASGDVNKFTINTDFRIGFAVNNQVLVYWHSKVAFFGDKVGTAYYDYFSGDYYYVEEDATFASGIGGIGVAYYFQPVIPSPYINATLGYSSFSALGNDNYDGEMGVGFAAGVGYEFAPHWTVEASLNYGKSSSDYLETSAFTLKAVISVLSF